MQIIIRYDEERRTDSEPSVPSESIFAAGGKASPQECQEELNENRNDQETVPSTRVELSEHNLDKITARENFQLLLSLCQNKAFDEGKAHRLLSATYEGIALQLQPNFDERLKKVLRVAQILIFQETTGERLHRTMEYELNKNPNADNLKTICFGLKCLENLLYLNNIPVADFARDTKNHFYKLNSKKNNLFFYGPPNTGKTMLMESLCDMHFNYTRFIGLSSFNFVNLVHRNAVFMDECKLTDKQFEQWKLLAAGQCMHTATVTATVLYMASNNPLTSYLTVPDAQDSIEKRTIQYNFQTPTEKFELNAFVWKAFWDKHTWSEMDVCDVNVNL